MIERTVVSSNECLSASCDSCSKIDLKDYGIVFEVAHGLHLSASYLTAIFLPVNYARKGSSGWGFRLNFTKSCSENIALRFYSLLMPRLLRKGEANEGQRNSAVGLTLLLFQ